MVFWVLKRYGNVTNRSNSIFFLRRETQQATAMVEAPLEAPKPSNRWCLNPKVLLNGTPFTIYLAALGGFRYIFFSYLRRTFWKKKQKASLDLKKPAGHKQKTSCPAGHSFPLSHNGTILKMLLMAIRTKALFFRKFSPFLLSDLSGNPRTFRWKVYVAINLLNKKVPNAGEIRGKKLTSSQQT